MENDLLIPGKNAMEFGYVTKLKILRWRIKRNYRKQRKLYFPTYEASPIFTLNKTSGWYLLVPYEYITDYPPKIKAKMDELNLGRLQ